MSTCRNRGDEREPTDSVVPSSLSSLQETVDSDQQV